MNEQDDLNWLAFRYVAGELDDAETQAFEARLETDQPAREAVAQSVVLTQSVAIAAGANHPSRSEPRGELAAEHTLAEHTLAEHTGPGRRSARGWVTALVVSAALLVLLSQFIRPGGRAPDTTASTAEVTAQAQLAEVWDAVREPLDEPAWTADGWEEDENEALELVTSVAESPVEDREAYWIEAAVIGLSTTGGEAGQIQ